MAASFFTYCWEQPLSHDEVEWFVEVEAALCDEQIF